MPYKSKSWKINEKVNLSPLSYKLKFNKNNTFNSKNVMLTWKKNIDVTQLKRYLITINILSTIQPYSFFLSQTAVSSKNMIFAYLTNNFSN